MNDLVIRSRSFCGTNHKIIKSYTKSKFLFMTFEELYNSFKTYIFTDLHHHYLFD